MAEAVLDRLPQRLFHYTTAKGIYGILTSGAIWATDIRFMNDAQELLYAEEIVRQVVSGIDNPALDPNHPNHADAAHFGEMFATFKETFLGDLSSPRFSLFAACFCESGDLLSQWRAYGSDHGYALEIRVDALRNQLPSQGGELLRVQYGQAAATTLANEVLNRLTQRTNLAHPGVYGHHYAQEVTKLLASVKHPGFEEEREWRALIFRTALSKGAKFRVSPMAIVPYVEIPLPRDAITRVIVGPGRHMDIRKEGVQRLLEALQCSAVVDGSAIPLRH